jgi:hypothetical protein
MKKLFNILFVILTMVFSANAQTISRKVLPTAGGTFTAGSSQITFTIGETVIPSFSAGVNEITQGFQQPGEQIRTRSVSSTICGASNFNISFTAIDIGGGNVFTAQLSNAIGSFASPTSIGTLYGNASAGVINVTIPPNILSGNGYRIRVTSSSPANIGADNGTNITISAAPITNISYKNGPFCNSGSVNVKRSGQAGGIYTSSPSGLDINSSTGKIDLRSSLTGNYIVTYSFSNGSCANTATTKLRINKCLDYAVIQKETNRPSLPQLQINPYFEVKAYPNPATYQFTVAVASTSSDKINATLYNIWGKMIKTIEKYDGESILFGDELPAGLYILVVSQGMNQKTIRLIKQ